MRQWLRVTAGTWSRDGREGPPSHEGHLSENVEKRTKKNNLAISVEIQCVLP